MYTSFFCSLHLVDDVLYIKSNYILLSIYIKSYNILVNNLCLTFEIIIRLFFNNISGYYKKYIVKMQNFIIVK